MTTIEQTGDLPPDFSGDLLLAIHQGCGAIAYIATTIERVDLMLRFLPPTGQKGNRGAESLAEALMHIDAAMQCLGDYANNTNTVDDAAETATADAFGRVFIVLKTARTFGLLPKEESAP
jgi:hypothetical protein